MNDERFAEYDYVISGHSHVPHFVEHFFASEDAAYRNKKRTIFINPGSASRFGHHTRLTFLRLDINGKELSHLEVYDEEK